MKRNMIFPTFGLALALALALQACGDSAEPKPTPPKTPPPKATPAPVPEPQPTPTPEAPPEPTSEAPVDAAAGEASYTTFCVTCHGVGGDGNTPFAQALQPPPTKHNDGNYMNALSDDYLFKVIKLGGMAVGKSPNMAPWGGSLSDQQIWNVVAYIRSLAVPPYTAPTP